LKSPVETLRGCSQISLIDAQTAFGVPARVKQTHISCVGKLLAVVDMVEITRLFWKNVVTSDAFTIGEIRSAVLDTETWTITNFYVALNDEAAKRLGFESPFLGKVMVCLPVSVVKSFKETVVLNKTFDELNELRECKP
jgi:sporulation protein YlmC with PRC-barrel domain